MLELNKIYQMDCLSGLKLLPDNSIDCCVTSPPYFNQRNYGTAGWSGGDENCNHESVRYRIGENNNTLKNKKETSDVCIGYKNKCTDCGAVKEDMQIGLETTLQEYIDNLVEIFEEVKRVLKPTGQLWLNIGDTYSNFKDCKSTKQTLSNREGVHEIEKGLSHFRDTKLLKSQGFKNKDLMMVPARLAIALQESGWYLRNDIIWAKATSGLERNGSCMPESVKDRFVSAHEHMFLLTKNDRYYFDSFAVKEPINNIGKARPYSTKKQTGNRNDTERMFHPEDSDGLANMRNVWRINLQPGSSGEHIAGYPEKLVEPCVKAGTSEYGCCKDCGKPYERILESKKLKRSELSIESVNYRPNDYSGKYSDINGKGDAGFNETIFVGWQKTCKCETDEVVPAIVLDPFMGSGTTAYTSLKLGRNFIGFELNSKYIEFANNRIKFDKYEKRYF